jgi:hypothetical protein
MLPWVGGKFDPDGFELDQINTDKENLISVWRGRFGML